MHAASNNGVNLSLSIECLSLAVLLLSQKLIATRDERLAITATGGDVVPSCPGKAGMVSSTCLVRVVIATIGVGSAGEQHYKYNNRYRFAHHS